VINWRTKSAQETRTIANNLVQQLRGRRLGLLAADKPIGLLTHHLAHNERIWCACEQVLEVLQSHKAVEFIDVAQWADEYSPNLEAPYAG
jgi:predicted ATPase